MLTPNKKQKKSPCRVTEAYTIYYTFIFSYQGKLTNFYTVPTELFMLEKIADVGKNRNSI